MRIKLEYRTKVPGLPPLYREVEACAVEIPGYPFVAAVGHMRVDSEGNVSEIWDLTEPNTMHCLTRTDPHEGGLDANAATLDAAVDFVRRLFDHFEITEEKWNRLLEQNKAARFNAIADMQSAASTPSTTSLH